MLCVFLCDTIFDSRVILCWNQRFFDTRIICIVNTKRATAASRCFHIMLWLVENEVLDVVGVAVSITLLSGYNAGVLVIIDVTSWR